ncbi:MAG: DUF4115 domain-containing protein [Candidatus Tantalella remota]|nr:DUF4115 domain-containing protein [Candidatus Tantalella remota]
MATSREIGKIFKDARQEKGLGAEEAAHSSHIHINVVRDIEKGVFDRLGKPYLKGFLRKYSIFLGIDTEDILRKYEEISSDIPGREFTLQVESTETEEKDELLGDAAQKKMQLILVAALSVVFLVLVFVLIGMVRSRLGSRDERAGAPVKVSAVKPAVVIKKSVPKRKPAAAAPEKSDKKVTVVLTLTAQDEVWVQIADGEERILSDIVMKKGEKKTWRSAGPLTVWTGKAGELEFTVNTRKLGVVAAGVVKNIKVSDKGVQVGDEWVAHLK